MKLNFPTTAQPVLKRACKRKNTTSVISKKIVAILANLNSKKRQKDSCINTVKEMLKISVRSTSISSKKIQIVERKNTQHQSIQKINSFKFKNS